MEVSWKLALGSEILVVAAVTQMMAEVNGVAFLGVEVVSVPAMVNLHWAYLNRGNTVSVVVGEVRVRILGIGEEYKAPSPIPETVIETVISHNYYLTSPFSSS